MLTRDWPTAPRACWYHGSGLAGQGRKLDLVGQPIALNVHDGSHVARFQPLSGHLCRP